VDYNLKKISQGAIGEATSKAEHYRYLNEPEESESICRDILEVEPENQNALRLLGLSIMDQFIGVASDRYPEAEDTFKNLTDRYERLYYTGLLYEKRGRAQLRTGHPPRALLPLFEKALKCFEEAEKIKPAGNDNAVLRWNTCVRLLQSQTERWEQQSTSFGATDTPPFN